MLWQFGCLTNGLRLVQELPLLQFFLLFFRTFGIERFHLAFLLVRELRKASNEEHQFPRETTSNDGSARACWWPSASSAKCKAIARSPPC